MTSKKPRVVLAFEERLKIVDLLRKHTRKAGDGLIAYVDDWDDERVAKAVGTHVSSENHVRIIRKKVVGRLSHREPRKVAAPPQANSQLLARVVFLEARVMRLYAELGLNA
jgi:hypothetical protein